VRLETSTLFVDSRHLALVRGSFNEMDHSILWIDMGLK
jgi:hypothetical protein